MAPLGVQAAPPCTARQESSGLRRDYRTVSSVIYRMITTAGYPAVLAAGGRRCYFACAGLYTTGRELRVGTPTVGGGQHRLLRDGWGASHRKGFGSQGTVAVGPRRMDRERRPGGRWGWPSAAMRHTGVTLDVAYTEGEILWAESGMG